ncbi:MAG: polymer-forming cytoskeletal protein [Saprospiraceae bacterium]|jgi:cytoskeletal protein CcmA (bactofilin family)|nr:polymer-forming cytoskeletal protein [Saprospiraceae bacterium]
MFGMNKKTEESKATNALTNPNALNSLVKGTVLEGTISSENDIRIDGIIKGTLTCKAKVIIGPTGFIDGEVRCENAIIEGKFEGNLKVNDLLHVKETAIVNGDIKTNKLVVQSGAVFNVLCNMNDSAKPNVQKPISSGEQNFKKVNS